MANVLFDEAFLRQLDQLVLLNRQVRRGQMQGERRSPKRGYSVEFADYRDYVPGDDLRSVDWNVYARLEKLFVKLSVEEEDTTVHLLLDASSSMDFGEPAKWQYAVRLSGALGYVALANTDRVRALALRQGAWAAMPPLRGKRSALSWFTWLQGQRPGGEAFLGPALRRYSASVRPAGLALLVSDLLDPGWEEGLAALSANGFETTVFHVLAPQELEPDLEGDIRLVDSEHGGAVEITADFDLLARYRDNLESWRSQVRAFCTRRGINYVLVQTSEDVETMLLSVLRRQGVIR